MLVFFCNLLFNPKLFAWTLEKHIAFAIVRGYSQPRGMPKAQEEQLSWELKIKKKNLQFMENYTLRQMASPAFEISPHLQHMLLL